MSERDILNHLANNVFAGSDTTAISLRAIFYYLLKNPSTYERLAAKVEENEPTFSEYVTHEESLKMPYL